MSLRGRRVLLAAGSALLIVTPSQAAEICAPAAVCVDPAFVGDTLAAYGVDTGVGSGDGVVCQYIKYTDGAPPGWNGGYGPPYFFSRTYSWGQQYPYPLYWQVRDCTLACLVIPSVSVCLMPPGSGS